MDKKVLSQDINVTFAGDVNTDPAQKIIRFSKTETVLESDMVKSTTGQKETGNSARGVITVYNKTDKEKIFSKGTVVISQNGVSFELKDDVKVASASDYFVGVPSTSDTGVVALEFGPEGNLPSKTNFSFKDYPVANYSARNNDSFAGGTRRQIRVAANDDITNLSKNLIDLLSDKAKNDLRNQIGKDNVFLPELLTGSFTEKDFDKKIGDEADQIKIHAKVKFSGFYYSKNDLEIFLKSLKGNIPASFVLDLAGSKEEIKNIVNNKKGDLSATLSLKALYLPKLDDNVLLQEFKGKVLGAVEDQINATSGVSDFKIIFKNKIGFLPGRFPFNPKKISITEKIND